MASQEESVRGVVQEALPNTMFRVELQTGETLVCYLAGKMRLHRIKVLVGDSVDVLLDPYGGKGRIVRRG
ncbi:MAG TPA: translation initiation factor IF-1 [Candidatus Paceibacterota bacterium]|jgi:translation initiation factor IF-1|nr:translation initiation factor IF-1 [Candidatus Paceibacterota bacterium]